MNNKFDKYNNYREYRCGRAAVCLDGKWGFVNTCGREIVPCVYDEVTDFSTSGFARVCKEGKWGFINREGRETVQCLYDAAKDMNGGLACVCLAGRWGLIWSDGVEFLPCKYDEAEYTGTDSIARVRKGDKWGLVKYGIMQIVDFKYDDIYDFDLFGQMAVVNLDGKYGLVNDEGDEIVPCIYEDVNDELGHDIIDLKLNGEWRTIDAFGKEIAPRKIEKNAQIMEIQTGSLTDNTLNNDKPQGIPDELFRVCAESRSARIGTMQFGVFVCDRYDVLVFTDDAGCVPHIHIVDTVTKGTKFNCCVELAANCYYAHNGNIVFLNDRHCRQLNDFMRQPCRNVHYRNNYEYAVDMWNVNNPDFAMQISEDANGEIIMPDYTTVLLTEHNNNKI